MSQSECRAPRRPGVWSCLSTLVPFVLLGVAPMPGRAQPSAQGQPAASSSADPRQEQPSLLVDALFAKHHHRGNQDPEWAVSTSDCLDHLDKARPHDVEAHEEAEKLRTGQSTPETAEKINAAAAKRNAEIDGYNTCLRGAATFTLPPAPSPTLYASIGKLIEAATSRAVDGLIRILEGRFGDGGGATTGAGANQAPPANQAPGASKPTAIPREHLPVYYGDSNRPAPVVEFAHGLSKGIWAAEVEDLPWALVNPAKRLDKYKRLAGTVAALSTGNSVVDLYNQLRQLDPTAPNFDLGYQAGRILRQGAHLREVGKVYARRPTGVAGAGAQKSTEVARAPSSEQPGSGGARTSAGTAPRGSVNGPGSVHAPTGYVLGKEVGHGSFGKVYELEGQPTKVLKEVWVDPNNPFSGKVSVRRQQSGYDLIAKTNADPTKPAAKDPIPTTTLYEARTPPKETPYLLMEHATQAPRWMAKNAYVKAKGADFTPDEQRAMRELGQKFADNGLVWSDPNPGNVSFFTEGGVLKAAVIDHDFIFPAKQAEAIAKSMRLKLNSLRDPNDPVAVNQALNAEQRVMFNKLAFGKDSRPWLQAYLDGAAFSAQGFMDAMASANGYR